MPVLRIVRPRTLRVRARRSQGRRDGHSSARNGGFENAASDDEWSSRRAACVFQHLAKWENSLVARSTVVCSVPALGGLDSPWAVGWCDPSGVFGASVEFRGRTRRTPLRLHGKFFGCYRAPRWLVDGVKTDGMMTRHSCTTRGGGLVGAGRRTGVARSRFGCFRHPKISPGEPKIAKARCNCNELW